MVGGDSDVVMTSSELSPRKIKRDNNSRVAVVTTQQKHIQFCQDLANYKKHYKEETFKNKTFDDREARQLSHQNLNLLT